MSAPACPGGAVLPTAGVRCCAIVLEKARTNWKAKTRMFFMFRSGFRIIEDLMDSKVNRAIQQETHIIRGANKKAKENGMHWLPVVARLKIRRAINPDSRNCMSTKPRCSCGATLRRSAADTQQPVKLNSTVEPVPSPLFPNQVER